jgi:hypothetical protein
VTETRCRWDREAGAYLRDGEPCVRDDYGDATRHCDARRTRSPPVRPGAHTCPRCIGRTRQDIRAIVLRAPELTPEALVGGVDSEAANLAGPASDPRGWSERVVAMSSHLLTWESLGRITERQYLHARATMEDHDELHPYNVLTRWHLMLAEDYGHPLPDVMTLSDSAAYLERILPRLAQDEAQDFPLFAREIRKVRSHLEAVLRDSTQPQRGAPCPTCAQKIAEARERVDALLERAVFGEASADKRGAPRLQLEHGHWCEDGLCDRVHYPHDPDRWVCPRNREHAWEDADYRKWVDDWAADTNRSA